MDYELLKKAYLFGLEQGFSRSSEGHNGEYNRFETQEEAIAELIENEGVFTGEDVLKWINK